MKKAIFALIITCTALTSCNTGNSTSNSSDSTSVHADTTNIADSTQLDTIK